MDIISDKKSLTLIWTQLISPIEFYDEYEFRDAFFDTVTQDYFVLTDSISSPTAVLPLQKERETGTVRFISSPFLERNRGFCILGCEAVLASLYAQLPKPYILDDISSLDPITNTNLCTPTDEAYVLNTKDKNLSSRNELLSFLPKNIRQNIQKLQKLSDTSVVTTHTTDILSTLTVLKTLTFERFGADSWLELPHIYNGFLSLPTLKTRTPISVICLEVRDQNETIAASISVKYAEKYYVLMAASTHLPQYSGIGSYLYFENIVQSIKAECTRVDVGIGDCGWKERWGFEKVPQFSFVGKGV